MTTDAIARASQRSIGSGSRSFAVAARLLDPATRESAHHFYAWCRHCDDVIDGQAAGLGQVASALPPGDRLALLEAKTRAALAGRAPDDPAFVALARLTERHALPHFIPLDILGGFRMDVEGRPYRTLQDLFDYCYGVAGAVGIGMAILMGVDRQDRATLDRACDLGLAFQLTNIVRDVMDDARIGRLYIPDEVLGRDGVTPAFVLDRANHARVVAAAHAMLEIAEHYYASARVGIAALDWRSAWAISTALGVYREIGQRIRRRDNPWAERQSVPCWRKLVHVVAGGAAPFTRPAVQGRSVPRTGLWTRVEWAPDADQGHAAVLTAGRGK